MANVDYQRHGATAELRLNRPDKLNALNEELLNDLASALDRAEQDDDIRVVLLHGEGRAFSAGADLDPVPAPEGLSAREHLVQELRRCFDLVLRFWDCPKPVIAAVHGYCLGSSMEITAACDITIASEDCRFGAPEVRFGSGIVCLILPWVIGQKHAREMLLVGSDNVSARRAAEIGLVNRVVPGSDLLRVARETAQEIALNDALAVRLTKRAIRESVEISGLREALEQALQADIEIETSESPESREFNRILNEKGLKEALAWRAERLPADGP